MGLNHFFVAYSTAGGLYINVCSALMVHKHKTRVSLQMGLRILRVIKETFVLFNSSEMAALNLILQTLLSLCHLLCFIK